MLFYIAEVISKGSSPDPLDVKLRKEGFMANHPVVFVPGIVPGGLELWEGHQCAYGLFRKRLWGGTFGKLYKRPKNFVVQHESQALVNLLLEEGTQREGSQQLLQNP
ncbi:unnamed protein product [Lupinus luteus]|uniref:Uncharacterized protein n=1 Tax=Lupinus luteus TaxID=3873 RepID=A0AAV1YC28_LUPLU